MKKIRVMHIISDTNIGGAGRLLYNLSRAIDQKLFELIIVLPKNSELRKLFIDKNEPVNVYTIEHGQDRSFDIKAILEIRHLIRELRPDIVHTHSSLYGKIGAKIAPFDTKKTIYTKHCVFDIPRIRKNKIVKRLYGWLDDRLADKIVSVADSAKKELVDSGVRPQKIKTIINGSLPLKYTSPLATTPVSLR